MPLNDKYLSLLSNRQLWHVTSEHSKGKLSTKEKVVFSFKYLFVYPFGGKSIFENLQKSKLLKMS